jgi:hypothetical protein
MHCERRLVNGKVKGGLKFFAQSVDELCKGRLLSTLTAASMPGFKMRRSESLRRPALPLGMALVTAGPKINLIGGGSNMLWFFRKAFGIVALVWAVGCLLFMVSCVVEPKAAGAGYVVMSIFNVVGIPASIAWAVLKVISVLSARRVAQPPSTVVLSPTPFASHATSPRPHASTSSILGLATPAEVPLVERAGPISSTSAAEPDTYTYSAPGMPMCPTCRQHPAIFYCSTHQSADCLECVAKA